MYHTSVRQGMGGSGDYVWRANDTSVAELGRKTGHTITVKTTNNIGTSLITTTDVKNSLHFATAQVMFASNVHEELLHVCGYAALAFRFQ